MYADVPTYLRNDGAFFLFCLHPSSMFKIFSILIDQCDVNELSKLVLEE